MNATKMRAKSHGTKAAFLTSLMSLILCFTMLVGTTLAWFTDTVTSGENQIIAGNLDVEVEYYDTTDSSWKTIAGSDSLFDKNALWEPGHTEYVALRIVNKGTLAFNYALDVTPVTEQAGENQAGGSFKLSDYLVFGTSEPAADQVTYDDRDAARSAAGTTQKLNQTALRRTGVLYAASDTNKPADGMSEVYTTLVVYMPETVGNEANYKTGTTPPQINLGVKVYAWQEDHEEDSFGDDYDILDIDAEGSGVKDASYTKVENVSAVVAEGVDTTFVSNMTPAMTGAADDKTTVIIPNGTVGFNADDNTMLTVAATTILPANRTAAFNIVDTQGSVGAIDLTVTVNDEVVSEFKDADGNDVPVTVTTYIAKGLTLGNVENTIAIKYVGDGGSDPTLVSYDTATGKLVFTTTHFSTFAIGADQAAYIEENNTAYLTLYDALEAVEGMENKTATIAMLKNAETVLSKSNYNEKIQADQGKALINGFVIASDMNVTIDLNGKTISNGFVADDAKKFFYTDPKANTGTAIINNSTVNNYGVTVFTNLGTLTLTDTVGTGKVVNSSANNSTQSATRNGYTSSVLYCLYGSTTNLNNVCLHYADNITTDTHGYAIYAYDTNKADSSVEKVTINIDGGSVTGHGYAMNLVSIANLKSGNASDSGSVINIKNGTTLYDESALGLFYVDGPYTINISDANFYSDSEYEGATFNIRKGTLNIANGSFSNPGYNLFAFGTSGSINAGTINVSGGNFISVDADITVPTGGKLEITGGTFNHNYAAYINEECYTSTPNGDGTYTVTAK